MNEKDFKDRAKILLEKVKSGDPKAAKELKRLHLAFGTRKGFFLNTHMMLTKALDDMKNNSVVLRDENDVYAVREIQRSLMESIRILEHKMNEE